MTQDAFSNHLLSPYAHTGIGGNQRFFLTANASTDGKGGTNTTDTTTSTGGDPGSSADDGGKGGAPAAGSGESKPEKTFTQADIDKIVKDRLAEQKRKLEGDAATAKAKEQGEWQAVAEKHEARVKELEPLEEQVTRYRGLLAAQIDAQIKDWPAEVKALDPGGDDLDARMAWVEKSKPLAEKLGKALTAPDTDAGKGGRPTPGGDKKKDEGKPQTYRFQRAGDVSW
jgi:hypothetical protein